MLRVVGDQPTGLAAYALGRLNWIHPFVEENGKSGVLLPDLPALWGSAARQKNRSRANSRKP